jgi:hypothetical protein
MEFRYDLFAGALNREAGRVYEAKHLSPKERLVFCRMIELAQHYVTAAMPHPVSDEQHIPDELLERLRQTLAALNDWQKQQAYATHGPCIDYVLDWKDETDASATVVPFPGT